METVVKHKGTVIITQRNVDIVMDISNGVSTKSAAKKYGVSHRTIEAIIAKLKCDFKCKNLPHLIATFFRKELIK